MGCEQMMSKMNFIMYGENLWRVNIDMDKDGVPVVQVDLHHMTCKEARKALSNIIALYRFGFKLDIIHGYNHGTALRDMIREDFDNPRICDMEFPYNQGRTILKIA